MRERSLTVIERGNQHIVSINQCTYGRTCHLSLNASHFDVIDAEEIGLARRVEVSNGDIDLLSGIS